MPLTLSMMVPATVRLPLTRKAPADCVQVMTPDREIVQSTPVCCGGVAAISAPPPPHLF